jgi:hypothetical protein
VPVKASDESGIRRSLAATDRRSDGAPLGCCNPIRAVERIVKD